MSGKTSKFHRYVLYFLLFLVFLRACGAIFSHEHDWQDATCTEPRTCKTCGETDGDPLGHEWEDATCTTPKTCARCGEREGTSLGHSWVNATCTTPEQCSICGKDRHWYSVPLGHEWEDATCTTPKTCARCGATEGDPQHCFLSYSWETTVEPTCQSEGEASHACMICGTIEAKVLPIVDHKGGDWVIATEATPSAYGVKKQYCVWCDIEIDSMEYPYISGSSASGSGSSFYAHNNPSQQNTSATYVLNTGSMKFHNPSCRDVSRISPANYSTSNRSRSELIAAGYSPCGHCSP